MVRPAASPVRIDGLANEARPTASGSLGRVRVLAALGAGALAISFAAPAFREAAPIDPLLASAVRLGLAAVLLGPCVIAARRRGAVGGVALRATAVAGGFYALHFGAWVASLEMTSVAASVTLVTATPLFLAVLGRATGRDAPSARLVLGVALASVGGVIIALADATCSVGSSLGDALALLGAAAMAGYLLVARQARHLVDSVSFSALAAAWGASFLALVVAARALALQTALPIPSWTSLGWVALTAVVSQVVGHTALTWALRHANPTLVALATTAEPVLASILAFVWLSEIPTAWVLAGCVATLAGVLVAITEGGAPVAGRERP